MSYTIAPAMSRAKIENFTRDIREACQCTSSYFDIVRFMEYVIPTIDETFNYEYVDENALPKNTYAYYDPENNKISVSTAVYERAVNDIGRDRFTIAHEIGHYFLHRDGCSYARGEFDVPKYRDPEWQANTFASSLLIPKETTRFMTPDEIQERCKVSYQAAEIAYKRNWQ